MFHSVSAMLRHLFSPWPAALHKLLVTPSLMHVAKPNPDFVGYEAGPDVVRE